MKVYKRSLLKYLLLVLLSLKAGYFVYESTSFFEDSESISILVDLEESESKEVDENEKINQPFNISLFHFRKTFKNHSSALKNYVNWHLEYKPHPPEFS